MSAQQTLRGTITLIFTLTFLLTACSGQSTFNSPEENPSVNPPTPRTLVTYANCDEALSDYQESLMDRVNEYMDDYLDCSTGNYGYGGDIGGVEDTGVVISSDSDAEASSVESGEVGYTGTNLQEMGVDEADIVKTDGQYIYVATHTGVDVFQAWPLDAFQKIATVDLEQEPNALYLNGTTLLAVFTTYNYSSYDYEVFTRVEFIDVEDPSTPVKVRVKQVEGWVAGSRLVDGVLHLVLSHSLYHSMTYPDDVWNSRYSACQAGEGSAEWSAHQDLVESARTENKERIMAMTLDDVLPLHGDEISVEAVNCTSLAKDDVEFGRNLLGLVSLDIDNAENETFTYIKGRSYEVYASPSSIYVAGNDYAEDATFLHKFSIGNADALHSYFGSGAVSGQIENSFSMSEYNGAFRIATSTGWNEYNNVFVLDANDGNLPLLGEITNIAPGESIYAVRFMGETGYVVTFEKVDPLFVINLEDPKNPFIEGELKMPGYSTYLHPLGEDHLIGIGKDAEDAGSFSWFQGLKLAIFDVSDGNNPAVADDLIVGTRGSDSYALQDHHAFTFDANTGILALPLQLYEGSEGWNNFGTFSYNGVHVYHLSVDGGIETLAEIELPHGSSEPERTLIVGDEGEQGLYVLDRDRLYLYDMDAGYNLMDYESL